MTMCSCSLHQQQVPSPTREPQDSLPVMQQIPSESIDRRAALRRRGSIGAEMHLIGLDHRLGAAEHAQLLEDGGDMRLDRSEEHTSELQSLMRNSYAVFCLKQKTRDHTLINVHKYCLISKTISFTYSPQHDDGTTRSNSK